MSIQGGLRELVIFNAVSSISSTAQIDSSTSHIYQGYQATSCLWYGVKMLISGGIHSSSGEGRITYSLCHRERIL